MKSLKINATLNVIQNICKIIFPLVTIPYVCRVLEASNFGKVSFGNSVVRYFVLLAALGIPAYAQREASAFRDDKNRISRFSNQVFSISVYSTIASYIFLFIALFSSSKLSDYAILIILQSATIILITLGADWINVVYEDYFYLTVRYIIFQLISIILLFMFVNTANDYYIYAIINIIATAGGNVLNIFYIRKYVKLKLVPFNETIEHFKPIMILFCVSMTTVIYINSDITILGFYLSDDDVGVYTIASNIYSVVKQVISAVIVVSLPRLAYYLGHDDNEAYMKLALKVLNTLIIISVPLICWLIIFSSDILQLLGGYEYIRGQQSLIILSVGLLFAVLAGFYANGYLLLHKKDKIFLMATTISAALNIGLNLFLIPFIGIVGAAITTLVAEFVMTFISFRAAMKKYRLIVGRSELFSATIGGGIFLLMSIAVKSVNVDSMLNMFVSLFIALPLYFWFLKCMNNPFANSLWIMLVSVWKKGIGVVRILYR